MVVAVGTIDSYRLPKTIWGVLGKLQIAYLPEITVSTLLSTVILKIALARESAI